MRTLILTILALSMLFLSGCAGQMTGNSVAEFTEENVSSSSMLESDIVEEVIEPEVFTVDAEELKSRYNSANFDDCGNYIRNGDDSRGNYADVYGCFSRAFKDCADAKAFFDIHTEGGHVVSFLSTANCKLTNHIMSDDPEVVAGEVLESCDEIDTDLALQYACVTY